MTEKVTLRAHLHHCVLDVLEFHLKLEFELGLTVTHAFCLL